MRSVMEKSPSVIRESCGTMSGYWAHVRRKEITCSPCRVANAGRNVAYRAENSEKVNALARSFRKENSAKLKAREAKYRAKNSEKLRSVSADYYAKNPGKVLAATKRWQRRNIEKCRGIKRRRRALEKGNGHEPYTEAQVLALHGTDCYLCGEPIDMKASRQCGKPGWERGLHIEHVVAITNGGPDTLENARPAHGLCNLKKASKVLDSFIGACIGLGSNLPKVAD